MTTKNTKMGTCPCCFGRFACDEFGRIVRHGWKEVGHGRRAGYGGMVVHSGGCRGGIAFEVSPEDTEAAIKRACLRLVTAQARLLEGEFETENDRVKAEREADAAAEYIAFATNKVENWKPAELADREVEVRRKSEATRASKAAKAAERDAKRAEKEARKAAKAAKREAALEALRAWFPALEVGTVVTLGAIKKATGASEGMVYDYMREVNPSFKVEDIIAIHRDADFKATNRFERIAKRKRLYNERGYLCGYEPVE